MSKLKTGRLASTKNARQLRRAQTHEKYVLWSELRGRRFANFKFRRQQPLGPYIVDFICISQKLIIEADGAHHDAEQDAGRDAFLKGQGYRILRIDNYDIKTNFDMVADNIWLALTNKNFTPHQDIPTAHTRITSGSSQGMSILSLQGEEGQRHMSHALRLARRGLGQVWPNPAVGCIIVKDNLIVGRGSTAAGGRPHAEAIALVQAGEAAHGATLYVTLEPCCQPGRGPACTDEIIKASIAKVIIAVGDPDPRVDGQGIQKLKDAGLEVTVLSGLSLSLEGEGAERSEAGEGYASYESKFVNYPSSGADAPPSPYKGEGNSPSLTSFLNHNSLMDEAATINRGFFVHITQQRPLVTLKLAVSQDMKLTTGNPAQPWITGAESRRHAHWLRATHDAILVGINTVLTDDPRLDCRLPGLENRSPVRIVLDRQLRVPLDSQLVQTAHEYPLWIVTEPGASPAFIKKLSACQVKIITMPDSRDIPAILQKITELGITRLLVEGGAQVAQSFLDAGCVDEIALYQASYNIGEQGVPAPQLPLDNLVEQKQLGDDAYRHYII